MKFSGSEIISKSNPQWNYFCFWGHFKNLIYLTCVKYSDSEVIPQFIPLWTSLVRRLFQSQPLWTALVLRLLWNLNSNLQMNFTYKYYPSSFILIKIFVAFEYKLNYYYYYLKHLYSYYFSCYFIFSHRLIYFTFVCFFLIFIWFWIQDLFYNLLIYEIKDLINNI